jgi:hypothetical protein
MAVLFRRIASLPPARGFMVWARRNGLINLLLSGLSNADEGIQAQTVKTVLLAYYQSKPLDLNRAAELINNLPTMGLQHLTQACRTLSEKYNWK